MDWTHSAEAYTKYYEAGPHMESRGQNEKGASRGIHGSTTLWLITRSLVTAGESWKELHKTDTLGGCLLMAYAPGGVTGLTN